MQACDDIDDCLGRLHCHRGDDANNKCELDVFTEDQSDDPG